MSASERIGRRGFIATALGLAAATVTARFDLTRRAIGGDPATDGERLARAFASPESAAELGHAYLATVPAERSRALLVDRIAAALPNGYSVVHTGDDATLLSLLAQRFQDDFKAGDTVTVDGWVVSRTQARLCGLAALCS